MWPSWACPTCTTSCSHPAPICGTCSWGGGMWQHMQAMYPNHFLVTVVSSRTHSHAFCMLLYAKKLEHHHFSHETCLTGPTLAGCCYTFWAVTARPLRISRIRAQIWRAGEDRMRFKWSCVSFGAGMNLLHAVKRVGYVEPEPPPTLPRSKGGGPSFLHIPARNS